MNEVSKHWQVQKGWLNYLVDPYRREGWLKLEPERPRAEVGFPTADQGFPTFQGTLFGYYGI